MLFEKIWSHFFRHFCQKNGDQNLLNFIKYILDLNINICWLERNFNLEYFLTDWDYEIFFSLYCFRFTCFWIFLVILILISVYSYCYCMILSRAQAKLVYACEWNPHAIEALQHNLQSNSVADRCVILEGDNRNTAPKVYW